MATVSVGLDISLGLALKFFVLGLEKKSLGLVYGLVN